LPHPGISERRAPRHEYSTARPVTVWLDGEKIGQFRHVAVRVEPDACTVVL
jgi:hypothetical protein